MSQIWALIANKHNLEPLFHFFHSTGMVTLPYTTYAVVNWLSINWKMTTDNMNQTKQAHEAWSFSPDHQLNHYLSGIITGGI